MLFIHIAIQPLAQFPQIEDDKFNQKIADKLEENEEPKKTYEVIDG
ncbi:MAG: hypothetical protein IPG07_01050 [Crocinitomicaceae bacterium]|nr:hypothetical protein [Crocinitomicaceae bacterium]